MTIITVTNYVEISVLIVVITLPETLEHYVLIIIIPRMNIIVEL